MAKQHITLGWAAMVAAAAWSSAIGCGPVQLDPEPGAGGESNSDDNASAPQAGAHSQHVPLGTKQPSTGTGGSTPSSMGVGGTGVSGSMGTGGSRPSSLGGSGTGVKGPTLGEAGAEAASASGGAPAYGGAGTSNEAGAPGNGSNDAGAAGAGGASACHFEYLGSWVRCEGENAYPWAKEVPNNTLGDCQQACLSEPTCVAVVDWRWLHDPSVDTCTLSVVSCQEPDVFVWTEEDAGKEYRKVCN